MSAKVLPASVLMPEYEALLREGAELPLVVSGGSMLPFLAPGRDSVLLKAPDRPLRRGDIVFYRRKNGMYVLHRLMRIRDGKCWMIGDAQTVVEGPLPESSVFAYVTCVQRKGKTERPGTFRWEFFRTVWLWMIPLRRYIIAIVVRVHRAFQKGGALLEGSKRIHHA